MIIHCSNLCCGKCLKEELHRFADLLEKIVILLEERTTNRSGSENIPGQDPSPPLVSPSMTVAEAAELLRISKPKMYELLEAKKIHSIRVGRKILVSRSSLFEYLSNG